MRFTTLSPLCRLQLRNHSLRTVQIRVLTSSTTSLHSHSDHNHSHDTHSHDSHSHDTSHSIFHSHTHTHDPSLLISSNKHDPGVRITRLGLWVNLGMAIVKGAGGYVFNSKSLMADAAHALSDLLSDFLTLATVSVALKHPTPAFPIGFGKVEALGSLGVSCMLAFAGLGIGVNAAESLYHIATAPELATTAATAVVDHVHASTDSGWLHSLLSHDHSHASSESAPGLNAAWLAAGSIVIKEYLFQATMAVAKQTKSTVLVANAWHHRVDCLTSVVAVIAITGSHFTSLTWLDPAGGLLVSTVILQAGYSSAKQAVLELADHAMPADSLDLVRAAVDKTASSTTDLVVDVLDVRGLKSGPVLSVDADIRISSPTAESVTLAQANAVAAQVKAQIAADVPSVRDVRIRTFDQHESDTSSWIDRH
ncbi:cation efflux family-domain-containing protein [Lipomyces arxii]|uniref:cation efflux family-domain-containing protein n=1 Tax=Lipomyces arxii TaxID=56418 RepID=UPI0034CDAEA0